MTNEEFERAVDFILKSQARSEEQHARSGERQAWIEENQAKTDEQLRQLSVRLDALADLQTNLIRVSTQTLEEQGRINASLRAADAAQARLSESLFESSRASQESLRAIQETQARINESLSAAIAELAAKQGQSEEALAKLATRVDALVGVVEGGRKGGG